MSGRKFLLAAVLTLLSPAAFAADLAAGKYQILAVAAAARICLAVLP